MSQSSSASQPCLRSCCSAMRRSRSHRRAYANKPANSECGIGYRPPPLGSTTADMSAMSIVDVLVCVWKTNSPSLTSIISPVSLNPSLNRIDTPAFPFASLNVCLLTGIKTTKVLRSFLSRSYTAAANHPRRAILYKTGYI